MYLEAVELCVISDVCEMVHVVEVPVVSFSRNQHNHPAKLMSHSLLQIGNHTGACNSVFFSFNNEITQSGQSYITAKTFIYFHQCGSFK